MASGAACAEGADGEMGVTGRGELGGAVSRGEGGTVLIAGRVTLSRRANSGVCASSSQDLSEFVVVKEVVGAATVVRSCLSGGAYFCARVAIGDGGSKMQLWELLLVVGKNFLILFFQIVFYDFLSWEAMLKKVREGIDN